MDETLNDNESLTTRIQQLERERDELRKDIEQLCMQQAGPSYLAVATRMHFQRTAGLEQEIENLKKKLSTCTRENINLQEELSEAYRIKSQLAELHGMEVSKNMEAEKQVKFFQGCVASAFAERDHSIMEAEKAKEKEEIMSQRMGNIQMRLEELTSDCIGQKKLNDAFRIALAKEEDQNKTFKKVIDKFYNIRLNSLKGFEDTSWDEKSECLLHDPQELWSFNDTSTSKYISALEEELETMKKSVDNLQNKLRMGLDIENHLKGKVRELEKKKIVTDKMIKNGIAELYQYHSQQRVHVMNLLDEGRFHMKSIVDAIEKKIRQFEVRKVQSSGPSQEDEKRDEYECRDVHMTSEAVFDLLSKRNGPDLLDIVADGKGGASKVLAQALQEKVAALLLLSQQEERHLLERNVNGALQRKIEELQRNLLQVTNEKVKALMDFAQLKQEYQLFQEKIGKETKEGKGLAGIGGLKLLTHERDGKLKNLLKRTYLRRWIGTLDVSGDDAEAYQNNEGKFFSKRNSMDFARMKIEHATLKESMESMEHLTSSIHRLRLSLLKAKESVLEGTVTNVSETLDDVINEAKLVKIALGSSLPISWSAEADVGSIYESIGNDPKEIYGESSSEKIDSVSAAGFEMVELLILAAQILKDNTMKSGC
ncbi:hypothetical protein F2P56_028835 [Juglans regia]|uniref:Uncharacterized protein n=2 Tax=Juglans regia TaxID=51240 RepID=A0A833THZ3_JUGRE|nr:uncharacterized protein LOC108979730 isoform X2 [Juglans regia]KAF5448281.1 hypothetical protein F2P56_028835 [Juglans regia]